MVHTEQTTRRQYLQCLFCLLKLKNFKHSGHWSMSSFSWNLGDGIVGIVGIGANTVLCAVHDRYVNGDQAGGGACTSPRVKEPFPRPNNDCKSTQKTSTRKWQPGWMKSSRPHPVLIILSICATNIGVRKVSWRLSTIHNKVYNLYLYNFRFAFTKAFHNISEMPVLPRSFLCDER